MTKLRWMPVVWLVLGGLLVIAGLLLWEGHMERLGREPLIRGSKRYCISVAEIEIS